uniref:Uncharacterized protein n=1 Tax=Arundo donax TaxID=35708 RepID=A0A0A9EX40_ARUDO
MWLPSDSSPIMIVRRFLKCAIFSTSSIDKLLIPATQMCRIVPFTLTNLPGASILLHSPKDTYSANSCIT